MSSSTLYEPIDEHEEPTAEERAVALFGRRKNRPGTLRTADTGDRAHLESFIRSREGVEAYLEPRTAVTETTVVLIADTGEWTRRRVPSPQAARDFARKNAVPLYDVAAVGYPQRMRDWTARRKATGDTGVPRQEP
jgi:hypothetical protein